MPNRTNQRRPERKRNATSSFPDTVASTTNASANLCDVVGNGRELVRCMSLRTQNWAADAAEQFATLTRYVTKMEEINSSMEARTDRSLELAQRRSG